MVKRREDLTSPRRGRRIAVEYDSDAFGRFAESIARFLGTARFLVYQSGAILLWIVWNAFAPEQLQFDPYDRGLVLLTLVLSLQAAYAAPLILLAQNRQEDRDRAESERDRARSSRMPAISRARNSVSACTRELRARSRSLSARSRSSWRFWASRISGAA